MRNFYYPPKPTSIISTLTPLADYHVQPKWRGWRICINDDNECFTRERKPLPIKTSFPKQSYEYQLDGEIISKKIQMEYHVKRAINENDYEIKIFDIFIPSMPNLLIEERLEILKRDFGIEVSLEYVISLNELNTLLSSYLENKMEGIVLKKKRSSYRVDEKISQIDNEWIKVKNPIYSSIK
jgi:ATP-dependent DNA ligase